jgi:hypothetical protein
MRMTRESPRITHRYTPPVRSEETWDPDQEFLVDMILADRRGKRGREFLVKWQGTDPNGKPWPDWWLVEEQVSDHLIDVYDRKKQKITDIKVEVELEPIVAMLRKSVAHAVQLAATLHRPRVHTLVIGELALAPLAEAMLRLLSKPSSLLVATRSSKRVLPVLEVFDDDGTRNQGVRYTIMEDIAAFTSFEQFISKDKATGALRFKAGRASNTDMMCVGMPLIFNASYNRSTPGLVTFTVTFPTVHVNGLFGTVQPPAQFSGMLKDQANVNKLVAYIKGAIPDSHPLVAKGWRALPPGVTTLPKEVAAPSECT